MQNTPSHSCCCGRHAAASNESRRGFLGQAAALICGGIALLTPAVVGIVAFLNPLRQKSQSGQFMRLSSLDLLPEDGTPRKVPVIADRTDAWNTYPAEPIGAVFLRRKGSELSALQVICPHAGCSINFESAAGGGKFFCPCHSANFDLAGKRTDAVSMSPRDMDTLEVEVRNGSEVWVKFQTFGVGTANKVAQG
jgi:menaquinol-cytochrome c reductase iron-sulfur subunit